MTHENINMPQVTGGRSHWFSGGAENLLIIFWSKFSHTVNAVIMKWKFCAVTLAQLCVFLTHYAGAYKQSVTVAHYYSHYYLS